jgi:hypothetical protein
MGHAVSEGIDEIRTGFKLKFTGETYTTDTWANKSVAAPTNGIPEGSKYQ